MSLASTIHTANKELIVEGITAAVADFFTSDYVAHLTETDMKGGHDAVRKYLAMIRKAFHDLQVEVEILMEAEDRVAWQRTIRATHRGTFQGFPATNRPIVWRDMLISQFRDGRIAEEWVISDLAEQLLRARVQ